MFRNSLDKLNKLWMPSRHLRVFSPTRPEIVIANNSGIFFSLASLKMHPETAPPNLKVILPSFWLDNTHTDYDQLNWGQNIRGIPWYARAEFLEIYPNQSDDKLVTWKQYKQLREYVISKLKSAGVTIFTGTPSIEKSSSSNYTITCGDEKFNTPSNTYFYNVFRQPDTKHGLRGMPERSHTQLYSIPSTKIPANIIIAGSGRSTYWLCNHFPLSQFACIKSKESGYALFTNELMPPNLVTYDRDQILSDNLFNITNYKVQDRTITLLEDTQDSERNFLGEFYCAIGLKPNIGITSSVSNENALIYPYYEKFDWFAPDIIPVGSLIESTLRWAVATQNLLWAFETHCYHENYFIEIISAHMKKEGIPLPLVFFDNLRTKMLEYFEDKNKRSVNTHPSDEDAIKIYKECYKSSNPHLEKEALKKFELCLRETLEARVERYNGNSLKLS
jgi:hypothetical protein